MHALTLMLYMYVSDKLMQKSVTWTVSGTLMLPGRRDAHYFESVAPYVLLYASTIALDIATSTLFLLKAN